MTPERQAEITEAMTHSDFDAYTFAPELLAEVERLRHELYMRDVQRAQGIKGHSVFVVRGDGLYSPPADCSYATVRDAQVAVAVNTQDSGIWREEQYGIGGSLVVRSWSRDTKRGHVVIIERKVL